jgi:hypothetical protein
MYLTTEPSAKPAAQPRELIPERAQGLREAAVALSRSGFPDDAEGIRFVRFEMADSEGFVAGAPIQQAVESSAANQNQ